MPRAEEEVSPEDAAEAVVAVSDEERVGTESETEEVEEAHDFNSSGENCPLNTSVACNA